MGRMRATKIYDDLRDLSTVTVSSVDHVLMRSHTHGDIDPSVTTYKTRRSHPFRKSRLKCAHEPK